MFFFFVGGVEQQVRQVLKYGAGRCISCSSPADLVDYDKVLKVFFVPAWRWPGKHPLLHCPDCNLFFPPPLADRRLNDLPDLLRCSVCNRSFQADYRYCPFCGSSL
ncbi:hypothetical protein MLD38_034024 [Melastoma candidum]|uniref:Uncharacterized protein n=1 Tax=Melastoma candidum TaxID=119954 RepID=A0ACB9MCZ0_9MYRT|nr:hypothetical protein MLD38_034024 [Melastoma candidum]